jgi:creatinine amidohydrolase
MLPKRYWHEMTTRDFADSDTSGWIAVLPVCAIEQHGPHLPVYTDTCIARGMVERVIELLPADLPVTFLPDQAVGKSNVHIASPGTLTLSWQTLTQLLIELGESVHRAGVRKLILINSHGGNVPILDVVARELRVRHGMMVVPTAWTRLGLPEGMFSQEELRVGIHGGDIETSMMLQFRPDLVKMEHAIDFKSTQSDFARDFKHLRAHGTVPIGWQAQDLNVAGTVGDASIATAEKGKAVIDLEAKNFIELCQDVAKFDLKRLWQG